MLAVTNCGCMVGYTMIYILGTVLTWRSVALINLSFPFISAILIFWIPETPYWLLSKNRYDHALKSLQWLRGWVSEKTVKNEFEKMQRYKTISTRCEECQTSQCDHNKKIKFCQKLRTIKDTATRPMIIVLLVSFFVIFDGIKSIRPYYVQIFRVFGVPIDIYWSPVLMGLIESSAAITTIVLIPYVGKRRILLFAMISTACCCILLGKHCIFIDNYYILLLT